MHDAREPAHRSDAASLLRRIGRYQPFFRKTPCEVGEYRRVLDQDLAVDAECRDFPSRVDLQVFLRPLLPLGQQDLFDGDLSALADTVAAWKTIAVALENGAGDLSSYGEVIHRDGDVVTLRVAKADTARVTARLLAEQEVLDLNVEDPPIEDVIELVFARESVE
jgi:hypothetical protein